MPRRTTRGSAGRASPEENTSPERNQVEQDADAGDETPHLVSYLTGLEPGSRIAVQRTSPTYARGWLEDLQVTPDVVDNLRDYLRTNYGGGVFILQARKRTKGGLQFARGAATVTIAGEPTLHGRRYVGGVLEEPPQRQQQSQPPVPIVMPSSSGGDPNVVQALLQLSQALGQLQSSGRGGDLNLDGVANLVGALQRQLPGGQQVDAFGNLERTVTFLGKLRKVFDAGDGGHDEPGGVPSSPFGGIEGGGFEQMMMAKLFGDAMQPQQQHPPQWNGQQWVRPVWNGVAWQWVPVAGPPPPGVPPQQQPPQQQPPQQQPQQQQQQQPQPQPQQQQQQAQPQPPAAAADDDDDDGPLQPDEVIEEIADLSPEQQAQWFTGLVERLPQHVQGALLQHVSAMVPDPGGGYLIDLPVKGKAEGGG